MFVLRESHEAEVDYQIAPGPLARIKSVRIIGSYAAWNDPRLVFGLGKSTEVERIEIRWPDGKKQELAVADYPIGRYHSVAQP